MILGEPVKVLQIGMTDNIGGMESYLMAQYRKLDREIVRYDFLNITGESQIVFSDEIEHNDDSIYAVPSRHKSPIGHYWSVFKLLYKKRHTYKYIVLNTCSLYYIFPLFAAFLVGIPHRVIHSHNSGDEIAESLPRKCLKRLNTFLLEISATDYWACSKVAGEWMFGQRDFRIIHNAIDVEKFIYDPVIRQEVRQDLGITNNFVIGNVARFSYQKNHEFLLDIFYEITKYDKSAILLLVGSPNGDEERFAMIKDRVAKYHLESKVLFLGLRKDTERLYQAMDCLVMPSRFEGLSVVAIEAQAAGLPCVVSDQMTSETQITDKFYQLSLKLSPLAWATKVMEIKALPRENEISFIQRAGYDINMVSKSITDFYTSNS